MTREYEGMSAIFYARVSTDDKGQTTETQIAQAGNGARRTAWSS